MGYLTILSYYHCFDFFQLSLESDDSHSVASAKELKTSKALSEIIYVESEISKLRSTAVNYSNYIPFLRIFEPFQRTNVHAVDIGRRRIQYNAVLLEELKERIKARTDEPCIQGNVLKDPDVKLSQDELTSISLSMMAVSSFPSLTSLISLCNTLLLNTNHRAPRAARQPLNGLCFSSHVHRQSKKPPTRRFKAQSDTILIPFLTRKLTISWLLRRRYYVTILCYAWLCPKQLTQTPSGTGIRFPKAPLSS